MGLALYDGVLGNDDVCCKDGIAVIISVGFSVSEGFDDVRWIGFDVGSDDIISVG